LNAFIRRYAGTEGFFVFSASRWSPYETGFCRKWRNPQQKKDQRMRIVAIVGLALAGLNVGVQAQSSLWANSVISYNAGTGYTPGYDNPSAALGEPSRFTPGQYGGPVDPFSPPWTSGQLVTVGAGGWLTVQFGAPVRNAAGNPFGLDFMIFNGSGFLITNGNYEGGGITDGTTFGGDAQTRVSVSQDGVNFYELNPSFAPLVDAGWPTDGSGNFNIPVNPALTGANFAGRDLAGIRALYAGSGGGAGYDIAWARDQNGQSVSLDEINYVRVDVLSGRAKIDGFAAVPEPATLSLGVGGVVFALLLGRRNFKKG